MKILNSHSSQGLSKITTIYRVTIYANDLKTSRKESTTKYIKIRSLSEMGRRWRWAFLSTHTPGLATHKQESTSEALLQRVRGLPAHVGEPTWEPCSVKMNQELGL